MRDLLKAILKTGSGSVATILFGMAAVKLIAWRLGPEALGSFSLTRQLIFAGSALFVTGGQTALVQGIASKTGRERDQFTSTSFLVLSTGSLALALLMIVFGQPLGSWIFGSVNAAAAMPIAAAAVAISGPMAFVYGALNAARRIGRLALAQALNAACLAAAIWQFLPLLRADRPAAFALVLALSQLPGLLLGTFFLWKAGNFRLSLGFSSRAAAQFARFALVTVAAAGLQAWTVLGVRGSVASRFGLASAGVFDAGWSISMVYVMLILSSFSTYYLPTLASAGSGSRKLIDDVLRTTLLLIVPLIVLVMALRPLVLVTLYSSKFLAASSLMHWMLIGDFFKVLSFVLAMPMLARADLKPFLAGEIGWNVFFFAAVQTGLRTRLGIESIGIAFAVSYFLYLIFALIYCARRLQWRWPQELRPELCSGVVILAFVSVMTWSAKEVCWTPTLVAITAAIAHIAFVLRRRGVCSVSLSHAAEVEA